MASCTVLNCISPREAQLASINYRYVDEVATPKGKQSLEKKSPTLHIQLLAYVTLK